MLNAVTARFYGLTFLQSLQYFDRYRKDCSPVKLLVLVVWLFDSTAMALAMQAVYMFAVARRNMAFADIAVPGSVEVERAFSFAVVFLVQMFYAGRVWYLARRHWYISVSIGLLSVVALVTGLAATVQASDYGVSNTSHPVSADSLSSAAAGLQIAVDVIITIGLYVVGWMHKSDPSEHFIRDALVNGVNRGVLSALLQILTTITYSAAKPRLVWMAFHLASSKVHAMSMLSVLNSRDVVSGAGHDIEIADAQLRYRVQRELRRAALPERPPMIPSIHELRSQSSWFFNTAAKHSDDGHHAKFAGSTRSETASVPPLSRGGSVHARSTTAVDGRSP
ncbi:hypothetical protein BD413DRAFT_616707 [Trametes elegans]|nr:hypothetical protein BD413DRAFT_616707 [Trametes elegans]